MPKDQTYSEKSETRPKGEGQTQGPSSKSGTTVPYDVIDNSAADPEPGEYCPPGTPPKDPRA